MTSHSRSLTLRHPTGSGVDFELNMELLGDVDEVEQNIKSLVAEYDQKLQRRRRRSATGGVTQAGTASQAGAGDDATRANRDDTAAGETLDEEDGVIDDGDADEDDGDDDYDVDEDDVDADGDDMGDVYDSDDDDDADGDEEADAVNVHLAAVDGAAVSNREGASDDDSDDYDGDDGVYDDDDDDGYGDDDGDDDSYDGVDDGDGFDGDDVRAELAALGAGTAVRRGLARGAGLWPRNGGGGGRGGRGGMAENAGTDTETMDNPVCDLLQ